MSGVEETEKKRLVLKRSADQITFLFRSRVAKVGGLLILGIVLLILLGSLFWKDPPELTSGPLFSAPSFAHPFGTDYLGQDILSQVIWGGYSTLLETIYVALGATLIGWIAGVHAGYFRRLEPIIGGCTDIIMTFPAIPLLLMIGTIFIGEYALLPLLLIVILWAPVARAVRAQTMSAKKLAYVEAAKLSGMNDRQIVWKIVSLEVAPIAISYFVINAALGIIILTALEFLGAGNPLAVNWGSILYWAQHYAFISGAWWWILIPGVIISLTTTGFALVGYSFEEILNPRLRS
jgi:peptide/nickel transport system permease protein